MLRLVIPLLFLAPLLAQTTDSVLTQTLIAEIRALRQELQATNVTSQRVQIALYRLQSQTAMVATAQQRLDSARLRLAEIQNQRHSIDSQVQLIEDSLRNAATPDDKKRFQEDLPRAKAALESTAVEETARQTALSDAESQLRTEQGRLADLQSLLDRLDKALGELAQPPK